MAQLVVRVDDDTIYALDELVDGGAIASRSHGVRQALARLIDEHRRAEIGRQIAEGYRRYPPDGELDADAEANADALVDEEPW